MKALICKILGHKWEYVYNGETRISVCARCKLRRKVGDR